MIQKDPQQAATYQNKLESAKKTHNKAQGTKISYNQPKRPSTSHN